MRGASLIKYARFKEIPMRRYLFVLLMAVAAPLAAQQPPGLEPVPEPPPMPQGGDADALEPEVTILKRGEDTVEEFRIKGRLYMVKVTPPHGVPYYLVDQQGDGVMTRQDAMPTLSVPMWVIKSW
jgi:hypothetical protein